MWGVLLAGLLGAAQAQEDVVRTPGLSLGAGILSEHGLSLAARADFGPFAIEGSGGLSMVSELMFSQFCTRFVGHAAPQRLAARGTARRASRGDRVPHTSARVAGRCRR